MSGCQYRACRQSPRIKLKNALVLPQVGQGKPQKPCIKQAVPNNSGEINKYKIRTRKIIK